MVGLGLGLKHSDPSEVVWNTAAQGLVTAPGPWLSSSVWLSALTSALQLD